MRYTKYIALVLLILTLLPFSSLAAGKAPVSQESWPVSVWLNGQQMALTVPTKIINSTTYVSIHDFCVLMGCSDVWEDGGVTVTMGDRLYLRCEDESFYMLANGRAVFMSGSSVITEYGLMVPIRALAAVFDMTLYWDDGLRRVFLTGGGLLKSADEYYDQDDLYWLAKIISAESRGEPLEGQIAVGNVVLNRVKCAEFPNTIYGVIFDRKNGVQFTPIEDGAIKKEPVETAVLAAKLCLEGVNYAGDSLYFVATSSKSNWMARNRAVSIVIGRHKFYY